MAGRESSPSARRVAPGARYVLSCSNARTDIDPQQTASVRSTTEPSGTMKNPAHCPVRGTDCAESLAPYFPVAKRPVFTMHTSTFTAIACCRGLCPGCTSLLRWFCGSCNNSADGV
jgi:hypothetical protein